MTCFPDDSTYATSEVSIVLDTIITSVMVVFCLDISLKEKKNKIIPVIKIIGRV